MNAPRVSILMSVRDERGDFLRQALDSILSQTFDDIELVLLDDGSGRRETIDNLNSYSQRDERIRLIRGPGVGLTRALNSGLRECRGEFVCRHDSDDWSELDRISKQVAFLEAHPSVAVVGSNVMIYQEDGSPLWSSAFPTRQEEILILLPFANPFCHGATCFRRSCAVAVGGYREQFACTQDYDFFWRLCERFGGANLPEVLYHHRYTWGSVSTQRASEQLWVTMVTRSLAEMRLEGREDFELASSEANQRWRTADFQLAGALKLADRQMLSGHYRGALRAYTKSILMQPKRIQGYLKLLRLIAFVAVPPVRQRLFVHREGR